MRRGLGEGIRFVWFNLFCCLGIGYFIDVGGKRKFREEFFDREEEI